MCSRAAEVRAALDATLSGAPGADQWLVANEGSVVAELADVFLDDSASQSSAPPDAVVAAEARRQLAAVTIRRVVTQGRADGTSVLERFLGWQERAVAADAGGHVAMVGCDVAAALLWRYGDATVGKDAVARLVAACAAAAGAAPAPSGAAAHRFLYALASQDRGKASGAEASVEALYGAFALPFLRQVPSPLERMPVECLARHTALLQQVLANTLPLKHRAEITRLVGQCFFVGAAADGVQQQQQQQQAPPLLYNSLPEERRRQLLDAYPFITDVMRIAASPLLTAELALPTLAFARVALAHYSAACAGGTFEGRSFSYVEPACAGEVEEVRTYYGSYSRVSAVHATLDASCGALLKNGAPVALLDAFLRESVIPLVQVMAIVDTDAEAAEEFNVGMAIDLPSTVYCAAVWTVSNFLKDPDDGGPSPEVPGAADAVSEALAFVLSSSGTARELHSALYMLQKLCEGELLPMVRAPVDLLLFFLTGEPGGGGGGGGRANAAFHSLSASDRALVGGRAAIAMASIAGKTLQPEQHTHLVHLLCRRVAEAADADSAATAAVALGRAVAGSCLNASVTMVQPAVVCGAFPRVLQLVPQSPTLLIESLRSLLEVLPHVVVTAQFIEPILDVFTQVLTGNEANTPLCARVLKVLSQGVIEEHDGNDPCICRAVVGFALRIMSLVLVAGAKETLQGLTTHALDIAAALGSRDCECSAVTLQLCSAVSTFAAEGNSALRASAKALALCASGTVRHWRAASAAAGSQQQQPPQPNPLPSLAPQLSEYFLRRIDESLEKVTLVWVVSSCLSVSTHLPYDRAFTQLVTHCNAKVSGYWACRSDYFSWPVSLVLMWPVLVSKAVEALGPAEGVAAALRELGGAPEQHLGFFAVWLTLDAVLEPRVRRISTYAACTLLTTLPQDYLQQPVAISPIERLTRRKPAEMNMQMTLCDALLLAVVRFVERPLTQHSKTFLDGCAKADLPCGDPELQTRAMQLLSTLGADKAAALSELLRKAACK
eukprot:Rhum_TRINITY_DN14533_c1_g1::Rhum_TRINITY_DN14533_c1_g1_i1::g.99007::m.99007